nr:MAG TPA: Rad52/22 family double-strand break repair protein [Caudoviricetes sp.]
MFRPLTSEEIDCRVATCKENGVSLLLYKDARVDQNILDETFGIFGWQRSHQLIDGNLYCTVSIRNPDTGEWVHKQDVGKESNAEKEKGQASDSFKRACFNLGIGRELYTAPFIWIPKELVTIKKDNKGKDTTNDRFSVRSITIEGGKIVQLEIQSDTRRCVVYTYGTKKQNNAPAQNEQVNAQSQQNQTPAKTKEEIEAEKARIQKEKEEAAKKELEAIDKDKIIPLRKMFVAYKFDEGNLLAYYHLEKLEQMTNTQYTDFSKKWKVLVKQWGGITEIKKGA